MESEGGLGVGTEQWAQGGSPASCWSPWLPAGLARQRAGPKGPTRETM